MSKTYQITLEPGRGPSGSIESWVINVGPYKIAPIPTPPGDDVRPGPWVWISNDDEGMGLPLVDLLDFVTRAGSSPQIVCGFLIDTMHRLWEEKF